MNSEPMRRLARRMNHASAFADDGQPGEGDGGAQRNVAPRTSVHLPH